MVTAMDDAIGNITLALKQANLYDNTIIVWLSDNGVEIEKGKEGKNETKVQFEEQVFGNDIKKRM